MAVCGRVSSRPLKPGLVASIPTKYRHSSRTVDRSLLIENKLGRHIGLQIQRAQHLFHYCRRFERLPNPPHVRLAVERGCFRELVIFWTDRNSQNRFILEDDLDLILLVDFG